MTNKKKKGDERNGQAEGLVEASPYSLAGIRQFSQEVAAEFHKIVWPDRRITLGLSGFVMLLTVVLSVYLGTIDFVLGKLVSLVLQQ